MLNYSIGMCSRYKELRDSKYLPYGIRFFGMPAENAAIKEGGHPMTSPRKTWSQ